MTDSAYQVIELSIDTRDISITLISGKGVRITHLPTRISAESTEHDLRWKNQSTAIEIIYEKLLNRPRKYTCSSDDCRWFGDVAGLQIRGQHKTDICPKCGSGVMHSITREDFDKARQQLGGDPCQTLA